MKTWKSELDLTNVTGTSYHWCHLITDVNDTIMHQLSNEPTKLLKILFKNLWMVLHAQLQWKNWDILKLLFDDKFIWYRCMQDVVIKFSSAINIKQTYLTIQLPLWMPQSLLIMSISGCFHPRNQRCLYLLYPRPKITMELW